MKRIFGISIWLSVIIEMYEYKKKERMGIEPMYDPKIGINLGIKD